MLQTPAFNTRLTGKYPLNSKVRELDTEGVSLFLANTDRRS